MEILIALFHYKNYLEQRVCQQKNAKFRERFNFLLILAWAN